MLSRLIGGDRAFVRDLAPSTHNVSKENLINTIFFCFFRFYFFWKLQCSSLVEEHEDDMISTFAKNEKDPHGKVCVSIAKVCPNGSTPSDEGADDDDFASEPYNFEHEEL